MDRVNKYHTKVMVKCAGKNLSLKFPPRTHHTKSNIIWNFLSYSNEICVVFTSPNNKNAVSHIFHIFARLPHFLFQASLFIENVHFNWKILKCAFTIASTLCDSPNFQPTHLSWANAHLETLTGNDPRRAIEQNQQNIQVGKIVTFACQKPEN